MSTPFTIRIGNSGDAQRLAAFAARLFEEAFARHNRPEDLAAYIAGTYGPDLQAGELVDPGTITLLAETEGHLAGFAQVRQRSQPSHIQRNAGVELQRFYVDRPFQGGGLARQLMAEALEAAARWEAQAVWLSCWQINRRAIAFYKKMGFAAAGTNDFWVGTDCQTDDIMIADLKPLPGDRR